MSRRGFSLAELMVALVIAGIIGIALARLVIYQARFVSGQDGMMRARSGARAALNVMQEELRMVSDSGLLVANKDSITVRVPYAYGVACGYTGGTTVVGLLPADSAAFASAAYQGAAWRDSLTNWRYLDGVALVSGVATTTCTTAGIAVLTAANWPSHAVTVASIAPVVGSAMYLYQKVTYSFAASVDLPGRRALWRRLESGLREELVAPFDTSAHFQFLVGPTLTISVNPPANIDSVYGVRVKLIAASDQTPAGKSGPTTFNLTTNLLFRNHVQY